MRCLGLGVSEARGQDNGPALLAMSHMFKVPRKFLVVVLFLLLSWPSSARSLRAFLIHELSTS